MQLSVLEHCGPWVGAQRMAALVQVSRTPFAAFEWHGLLPGVGEALKREIAGLGLVGCLLLWGFERCVCFESDLTDPLSVVC